MTTNNKHVHKWSPLIRKDGSQSDKTLKCGCGARKRGYVGVQVRRQGLTVVPKRSKWQNRPNSVIEGQVKEPKQLKYV